jgi:hypothetical protein
MANGAGRLSVVDSVVREVGVKFCVAEVCYASEGESIGGGGTEERKEDGLGKHDVDSEGKSESNIQIHVIFISDNFKSSLRR